MTICCHDRHRWSGHPLGRARPASYPVLVHRLAPLLHASFRPRLAATPLRFAITSPLSGCEEDLHLQAVEHARRTKEDRLKPVLLLRRKGAAAAAVARRVRILKNEALAHQRLFILERRAVQIQKTF